jgi:hypothetical protein
MKTGLVILASILLTSAMQVPTFALAEEETADTRIGKLTFDGSIEVYFGPDR